MQKYTLKEWAEKFKIKSNRPTILFYATEEEARKASSLRIKSIFTLVEKEKNK